LLDSLLQEKSLKVVCIKEVLVKTEIIQSNIEIY